MADSFSLAVISGFASFAPVCFYLAGGLAGDRFTKYRVMALFAVIQALGILVMVPAQNIPVVSLALVLMSVGAGGLVPLSLAIMPDYFGTGSLGSILGVQGLIAGLAAVLGSTKLPVLAGDVRDRVLCPCLAGSPGSEPGCRVPVPEVYGATAPKPIQPAWRGELNDQGSTGAGIRPLQSPDSQKTGHPAQIQGYRYTEHAGAIDE